MITEGKPRRSETMRRRTLQEYDLFITASFVLTVG